MKYSFEIKNNRKELSPLYLVITHDKNRKYFNTNIYISKNHFKNGKVIKNNLSVKYNIRISEIENIVNTYIASKKDLRINELIHLLDPQSDLFTKYIELNYYATGSTLDKHKTALNYLISFDSGVRFSDLSNRYVGNLIEWLRTQKNKRTGNKISDNYINTLLSVYSSYCKLAIKEELLKTNYFVNNKLTKTPKTPVWLTLEEIEKIGAYDVGNRQKFVAMTIKSFVLCCYCGLRVNDLDNIHINQIKDGWLNIKPEKVDKYNIEVDLPLHKLFWGRPLKILQELEKPYAKSSTSYIIQEIALAVGIDKKITWHVARHSFAMNLLNLGLPLEGVQKLLGHKSITTTEIYARLRRDGLDKRIDEVFG